MTQPVGAIVLAGGRSSRLGRAKEEAVVGGTTMLERTIAACGHASTTVIVGPRRHDLPDSIVQVREQPVHGGPVSALAAALPYLREPHVLVLACDMPRVGEAVPALHVPGEGVDAVIAHDRGRAQPLAGYFRRSSLVAALARLNVDGASMRSVVAELIVDRVDVPPGSLDDVDDPDALQRAVVAAGVANSDARVREAMITHPKVFPADATVGDLRSFFTNAHVHVAILTDSTDRVVTVVTRDDLDMPVDDLTLARTIGQWHDRWVYPDEALEPIQQRMIRDRTRRLVVVDTDRRLLGLLCMKRRFNGFCSAADVKAREQDRA